MPHADYYRFNIGWPASTRRQAGLAIPIGSVRDCQATRLPLGWTALGVPTICAFAIRARVAAPLIFWRLFSASERSAAKLKAASRSAAHIGGPATSSMPGAATIAAARAIARPSLRVDIGSPHSHWGNLT